MSVKDNSYGIADLQDKMLDIVKYFVGICEKNGLTYWAGAGTCLGAIRHGGFIPWDDDVDIFMPRKDYELLWENRDVWSDDSNYKIVRSSLDKNYRHRVMQIVDLSTTFINKRCVNDDIEHGVYIDIIPLDTAAPTAVGRLFQAINTVIYSVYNIQVIPEFHGNKLMIFGTRMLLGVVKKPEKRYKIWKKAEKRMSRYENSRSTNYVDLLTYLKMIFKPMPKEWFEQLTVPFEDTEIAVPKMYDNYLKAYYGDYMTLPPEDRRSIQHKTVIIDLEKPFTEYRGIYYKKEENGEEGNP